MSQNQSQNVQVTLTVPREHCEIFARFADLYGEPVEEYVLTAAKSSVSSPLNDEENGELEGHYRFLIHKRHGGTD